LGLHHTADALLVAGRDQKMNVVGYQDKRMGGDFLLVGCIFEKR
jgi:hypothetical protein